MTKCPSLAYGFPEPLWADSILASLRIDGGGCGLLGRTGRGAGGVGAIGDGVGVDDLEPPNSDAKRPLILFPVVVDAGAAGRGGRGGG